MKKRMLGIFLACLCIIGMLTSISAVEGEITDSALAAAQAEAELAATYPQCPCGGRGRDFISTSSNTHTVRCRVCKLTIVYSESCTPLMSGKPFANPLISRLSAARSHCGRKTRRFKKPPL